MYIPKRMVMVCSQCALHLPVALEREPLAGILGRAPNGRLSNEELPDLHGTLHRSDTTLFNPVVCITRPGAGRLQEEQICRKQNVYSVVTDCKHLNTSSHVRYQAVYTQVQSIDQC